MGELTNYAEYDQRLPFVKQVYVGDDVSITPANTFTDVATFGTLKAGLYMFSARINMSQGAAAAIFTAKFLDGSTGITGVTESVAANFAGGLVIPNFVYNLLADGIVKLQVATTNATATLVLANISSNGTGLNDLATCITAIRLR